MRKSRTLIVPDSVLYYLSSRGKPGDEAVHILLNYSFSMQHPQHTPKFDPYCNDMWMRRHLVLQRFVQAGRRVILRLSCQKKLERLQRLRGDLTAGKSLAQSLMDLSSEKEKDIPSVVSKLPTSSHHILPFSFPKYLDTSRVDETVRFIPRHPPIFCLFVVVGSITINGCYKC